MFANKLIELAELKKEALSFPFTFNFSLHGKREQMMSAPWYYCMAQGKLLSTFVQLYRVISKKAYLFYAKRIFGSFTLLKNDNNETWASMVDENNYLWFEEYPWHDMPNYILNGFILLFTACMNIIGRPTAQNAKNIFLQCSLR